MERYFFRDNPELFKFEKIMQQVPGFDKKKESYDYNDRDNYERTETTVRIIEFDIPEAIENEYEELNLKEFFLNEEHKKNFISIYLGPKGKRMRLSSRYAAAVYFLSAHGDLWDMCQNKVAEFGIFFKEMKLGGLDLEGYILFQAAKSVYYGYQYIQEDELKDSELVYPDMLRTIANGFHILREGNHIMREAVRV